MKWTLYTASRLVGLTTLVVLFACGRAQGATIPDAVIARALQITSADVNMLEPVSADAAAPLGSFWSVQNRFWPPVPFNWLAGRDDYQLYKAGVNDWIIDDRLVDYSPQPTRLSMDQAFAASMDEADVSVDTPGYPAASLWLEIGSIDRTNQLANVILHGTQPDHIYEVWTRTNLAQNDWSIEGTIHGLDADNSTPAAIPVLNRTNLFVWARDWTAIDENSNSVPDSWEWENFASLNQPTNGDFDGDGIK